MRQVCECVPLSECPSFVHSDPLIGEKYVFNETSPLTGTRSGVDLVDSYLGPTWWPWTSFSLGSCSISNNRPASSTLLASIVGVIEPQLTRFLAVHGQPQQSRQLLLIRNLRQVRALTGGAHQSSQHFARRHERLFVRSGSTDHHQEGNQIVGHSSRHVPRANGLT